MSCAPQAACSGFGGEDPSAAYDELLATAAETPIPAPNFPEDPRAAGSYAAAVRGPTQQQRVPGA